MRCCLLRSVRYNFSWRQLSIIVRPAGSTSVRLLRLLSRHQVHHPHRAACERRSAFLEGLRCVDVVDVKWFLVSRSTIRPLCCGSHIFTGFSAQQLGDTLFSLVSTRERVQRLCETATQRGATMRWRWVTSHRTMTPHCGFPFHTMTFHQHPTNVFQPDPRFCLHTTQGNALITHKLG